MIRKSITDTSVRTPKKLGELLLEDNIISQKQLDKALELQETTGGFFGQILVEQGFITQDTLIAYLSKQCQIPHLSLLNYRIGEEALAQVPEGLCLKHYLIPVDKMGRILTLAMVDPLDEFALDEIKKYCPELRIKPVLCSWEHFKITMKQVYDQDVEKPENLLSKYTQDKERSKSGQPKGDAAKTPAPGKSADAGQPSTAASETSVSSAGVQQALESTLGALADEMRREREALREELKEMQEQNRSQNTALPTEQIASALAASMGGVLETTLGKVAEQLREVGDTIKSTSEKPQDDGIVGLQTAVADAVRQSNESMSAQFRELLEAFNRAKTSETSVPAFADVIRDSVGAAMERALVAMSTNIGALVAEQKDAAASAADLSSFAGLLQEKMGSVMETTMTGMTAQLRSLLEHTEAERSAQAENQAHLEKIAQATLDTVRQTTQLIEAHTVAENNRSDMLRHKQAKHASVVPFLSANGIATPVDAPEYAEQDLRVRDALDSEQPLEALTFDNFFAGEANAFTVKLAKEVAAKPGGEYNPLFIYGKVGLGKTHLISAIGNANCSVKSKPPRRIGYISASHFARRLAAAVADNALELFRDNYCHWDILILDDIQFLGGRVEAQEEFFHIFNVLLQQSRQIIIASDKAPDHLGMLEQRLVSRFASGIVVELVAPEWDTRMKILHYHAERDKVKIPEEILSLVAMRVPGDIRKMTGALRKIIAFARLSGDKMTLEDAQKVLSHLGVNEAA